MFVIVDVRLDLFLFMSNPKVCETTVPMSYLSPKFGMIHSSKDLSNLNIVF